MSVSALSSGCPREARLARSSSRPASKFQHPDPACRISESESASQLTFAFASYDNIWDSTHAPIYQPPPFFDVAFWLCSFHSVYTFIFSILFTPFVQQCKLQATFVCSRQPKHDYNIYSLQTTTATETSTCHCLLYRERTPPRTESDCDPASHNHPLDLAHYSP